jgi:hypothetical protein
VSRSSLIPSLLASLLLVGAAGCASSTDPGGDPDGDLNVEFRNFTGFSAAMGQSGKSTVTVAGNLSDGNPTLYAVVNPGIGNSLSFTATWNGSTLTATCTVSDITGVSVPPSVVIQPLGFLDCSGW